jgi:predicted phosphodiesterase
MFRNQDGYIANERGKVIAVQGNVDNENRNLVMEQKNGNTGQRWRVVYVD